MIKYMYNGEKCMKKKDFIKNLFKHGKYVCLIVCLVFLVFLISCEEKTNDTNKEYVDNLFTEFKNSINEDDIQDDIVIPEVEGVLIFLESSDESVIDVNGVVTPKENDELIILKITFEYQGSTYVKNLEVVVKGTGAVIDSSKQDEEYVNSIYDEIVGDIAINEVVSDLSIPSTYKNVRVSFNTSNQLIISTNGIVNRPQYDETVILTFVLEYNNKIFQKELEITVKGTNTSDTITAEMLNDIISQVTISDDYKLLDSEIELPSKVSNYPINWSVNNDSVLVKTVSGIKKLVSNDPLQESSYILTATIAYGNLKATKEFNGIVKAISIEKKILNIQKDLDSILQFENNTINENIDLKNSSLYDSIILWESSNEDVLSNQGVINKNLDSEQTVTIRYTIILDNVEYEYQFKITVSAKTVYISYYSSVDGKTGNTLFKELRSIITRTHTKITNYDDCKKESYIKQTDGDPNKPGNIILFWSGVSIKFIWDSGNTWNREHVWPQSQGWFKTSGAGADLHHIRPVDSSINSAHGNDPYAVISGGTFLKTSSLNGSVLTNCKKGGSKFEPADDRKGDTARIIFYLLTRYPESDNVKITNVATSIEMLLEWHESDPVDQLEINRNEAVCGIQGNRNPFIDYPEFADMIW